ncbi:MAG: sugar-binding protein [Phycisphaerae bacterium]
MRHIAKIVGPALAFMLAGCAAETGGPAVAPAPQTGPDLKLTPAKARPPKVDGVLDDATWKQAAVFTDFKPRDGSDPKGKARLLVAQDDKALYVAVECFESEAALKSLAADCTQHDGDGLWKDDSVELFLGPDPKTESYYQFIVNSKGVTMDAYYDQPGKADLGWEPKYQCAAKVGKDSWVVEMALPWAVFDRTPKLSDTWLFQCQHERTAGPGERLMFVAFKGSSHQPDKFGKLAGVIGRKGA